MFKKSVVWLGLLAGLVLAPAALAATEEFGGLGLTIAQLYDQEARGHRGNVVVLNVHPGSPAEEKGIQKGDVILRIDGEALAGMKFERIVLKKMRGRTGSESELVIRRDGLEKPIAVRVTRTRITYPPEKK